MAVEAFKSTELGDEYRGSPINDHSKVRLQYFNLPAVTVAGDANSTIDLCDLPPGAIRVIPELSRILPSAYGASRVMKIGHRAYQKADAYMNAGATDEAEDDDAFGSAIDVATAVNRNVGTSLGYSMSSKSGIRVFATVTGGTIPIGGTLKGFLAYTYE